MFRGMHQPSAQVLQMDLQDLQHRHRGGHLQLPGRGQLLSGDLPQPGPSVRGADPTVAQRLRAVVEAHRVDTLHPAGVLTAQIVVEPQQRPTLQHLPGWDPTLREPVAVE